MAVKLHCGTSKKIGTGDFGSVGAQCGVEVELDHRILEQPEAFHDRLLTLFETCRNSVQHELDRQTADKQFAPSPEAKVVSRISGRGGSNGNGVRRPGRDASDKQLRFIRTLAAGISGLDDTRLAALCERMYNASVEGLGSLDASSLIDTLQDIKQGKLQLERLLGTGADHDPF